MAGDFSYVNGNVPLNTKWDGYVRDQVTTICTSSTRPSDTGLVTGRKIYETDTGNEYRWSGSAWVLCNSSSLINAWTSYTPYWYDLTSLIAGSGGPTIGNGTLSGRYRKVGKTLEVQVYFQAGSTTTFGTGLMMFSGPLLGTPRFFDVDLQLAFQGTGPLLYDVGEWAVGEGMIVGVGTWSIDAVAIGGLVVVDGVPMPRYYYDRTALPSSIVTGKTNGFYMAPRTATSSSAIELAYIADTGIYGSPFDWTTGHYMFFSARVELL